MYLCIRINSALCFTMYKDLAELTTSDAIHEWSKPIVARENFSMFQLVQGKAGNASYVVL